MARLPAVTLRQLRAFVAVAEEGSIARAAQRLHLTGSALSMLIASLEGELGTRLFERTTRRLQLTDAGRELLPAIGEVFHHLDNALSDLRESTQRRDTQIAVVAGEPVLVLQNLGLSWAPSWHYAVAVGYDLDAGTMLLRSGPMQRQELALRTFEHTWKRGGHWAFVTLPPGTLAATASEADATAALVAFERSAPPVASAKGLRRSAMQFQNPALRGLDPDWSQTATATVAALRQALGGAQ